MISCLVHGLNLGKSLPVEVDSTIEAQAAKSSILNSELLITEKGTTVPTSIYGELAISDFVIGVFNQDKKGTSDRLSRLGENLNQDHWANRMNSVLKSASTKFVIEKD